MIPRDTLAVIGGSGAHTLLQAHDRALARDEPMATPFGLSAPIYRVRMEDAAFLFLPRHGETGYETAAPWVNYRANIYALKELGVSRIVSWSGPGALSPSWRIGQYALPHDLLDFTQGRESTFYKGTGLGFIRQHPVFCPHLSEAMGDVLQRLHLEYTDHAVYACTQGPRLETPAEIRFFRNAGADVVGMTLAPETFLARELEMCYAPICYITNYAEGVGEREPRPGELFEGLLAETERAAVDEAVSRFLDIATLLVRLMPTEHHCTCGLSMERYRREGRVGDDWHSWLGRA